MTVFKPACERIVVMSNTPNKREQALEACEKAINGIEKGTISVSSALLLCKKIARLVNDPDGMEWLNYEYSGYPNNNGIPLDVWKIGAKHGRIYRVKDKEGKSSEHMFIELCGELESRIESDKKALANYSTQGFSVSGEYAVFATSRMTTDVQVATNSLLQDIRKAERHLSILKAQYYDYAVKWQIELQFGHVAETVFEEYQGKVDRYFSSLPTTTVQKLNAIKDLMEDGNPERYAQVLTSCRRLWTNISKVLFDEVLPNYSKSVFKTQSGKEIDVSGDHDNNKLSAVIETLQSKSAKNTLVGSETTYLIDWMEQINRRQNEGVHSDVTRGVAMRCIIHTYIALGDILSLKEEVDKQPPALAEY